MTPLLEMASLSNGFVTPSRASRVGTRVDRAAFAHGIENSNKDHEHEFRKRVASKVSNNAAQRTDWM